MSPNVWQQDAIASAILGVASALVWWAGFDLLCGADWLDSHALAFIRVIVGGGLLAAAMMCGIIALIGFWGAVYEAIEEALDRD